MACFYPITGYRARRPNANGKWPVVFNPNDGHPEMQMKIPCGQCIGCRLERSRQWAVRCIYESKMHDQSCFITLTFNDDHLNPEGSLVKSDFQKFMKRLRKQVGKVRYFHCGEYGDQLKRPHHHACLFGYDFPDKKLWRISGKVPLYRSGLLESLWPFGYSSIGECNFETCAYVARYIMKKQNGKNADAFYQGKEPEYVTMSRRPGIGATWFEKYKNDVYPFDEVIVRGVPCRPPAYFDRLYDIENPYAMRKVKKKRNAHHKKEEEYIERLVAREQVTNSRVKRLERSYEKENVHDPR